MSLYSFSGLDLSSGGPFSCLRKVWFRYGLGLRGSSTPALEFGKACHGVIETMIKHQDTSLKDALIDCLGASMDFTEDKLQEMHKCVSADAVVAACERGGNVETYFEEPLDASPFSPSIRGYIDYFYLEDDKIHLLDWKTSQRTYNPLDTHQLGLYARVLNQKYSLPVVGHLVFLRFNRVISHEYTEEDMAESFNWALDTALEYDARFEKVAKQNNDKSGVERWFPKQYRGCDYCTFKEYCLERSNVTAPTVTTPEEAKKAIKEILEMKEFQKNYEANLKEYVKQQGVVRDGTYKAELNKSEYLTFDLAARKKVIQEMLNQNIDLGAVLKIGSDAQKDLMSKHQWDEEDFFNLGAKKRSKTWLSIKAM